MDQLPKLAALQEQNRKVARIILEKPDKATPLQIEWAKRVLGSWEGK